MKLFDWICEEIVPLHTWQMEILRSKDRQFDLEHIQNSSGLLLIFLLYLSEDKDVTSAPTKDFWWPFYCIS